MDRRSLILPWLTLKVLLLISSTTATTLLGIGSISGTSGLDLSLASFNVETYGAQALSRLLGTGLSVELDKLELKVANAVISLTPQSMEVIKGGTKWSMLPHRDRIEYRRNNDLLFTILTFDASGSNSNQEKLPEIRFSGRAYLRDAYLDQREGLKSLSLLCRSDRSLTSQRKADVCGEEINTTHLSALEVIEYLSKIAWALTESHLNEKAARIESLSKLQKTVTDSLTSTFEQKLSEQKSQYSGDLTSSIATISSEMAKLNSEALQKILTLNSTTAEKLLKVHTLVESALFNMNTSLAGQIGELKAEFSSFFDLQTLSETLRPILTSFHDSLLVEIFSFQNSSLLEELQQQLSTLNFTVTTSLLSLNTHLHELQNMTNVSIHDIQANFSNQLIAQKEEFASQIKTYVNDSQHNMTLLLSNVSQLQSQIHDQNLTHSQSTQNLESALNRSVTEISREISQVSEAVDRSLTSTRELIHTVNDTLLERLEEKHNRSLALVDNERDNSEKRVQSLQQNMSLSLVTLNESLLSKVDDLLRNLHVNITEELRFEANSNISLVQDMFLEQVNIFKFKLSQLDSKLNETADTLSTQQVRDISNVMKRLQNHEEENSKRFLDISVDLEHRLGQVKNDSLRLEDRLLSNISTLYDREKKFENFTQDRLRTLDVSSSEMNYTLQRTNSSLLRAIDHAKEVFEQNRQSDMINVTSQISSLNSSLIERNRYLNQSVFTLQEVLERRLQQTNDFFQQKVAFANATLLDVNSSLAEQMTRQQQQQNETVSALRNSLTAEVNNLSRSVQSNFSNFNLSILQRLQQLQQQDQSQFEKFSHLEDETRSNFTSVSSNFTEKLNVLSAQVINNQQEQTLRVDKLKASVSSELDQISSRLQEAKQQVRLEQQGNLTTLAQAIHDRETDLKSDFTQRLQSLNETITQQLDIYNITFREKTNDLRNLIVAVNESLLQEKYLLQQENLKLQRQLQQNVSEIRNDISKQQAEIDRNFTFLTADVVSKIADNRQYLEQTTTETSEQLDLKLAEETLRLTNQQQEAWKEVKDTLSHFEKVEIRDIQLTAQNLSVALATQTQLAQNLKQSLDNDVKPDVKQLRDQTHNLSLQLVQVTSTQTQNAQSILDQAQSVGNITQVVIPELRTHIATLQTENRFYSQEILSLRQEVSTLRSANAASKQCSEEIVKLKQENEKLKVEQSELKREVLELTRGLHAQVMAMMNAMLAQQQQSQLRV